MGVCDLGGRVVGVSECWLPFWGPYGTVWIQISWQPKA